MWKVIGASVTGISHQAAGKACEDAADWRTGPGLTCLAVADGAGSRPRSGTGAALAVERALAQAFAGAGDRHEDGPHGDGPHGAGPDGDGPHGDGPGAAGPGAAGPGAADPGAGDTSTGDPAAWLRLIFEDARGQIAARACADGNEADDYATTLAVALLTSRLVIIGQIGDTIAVAGHAGRYQAVAPAPRGEYVNETTFITAPGALAELRITVIPAAEVDTVVLGTDGLRFKVLDLPAGLPFTPFFEDLAAYARSPQATQDAVRRFLAELDDQSGDDKTLVAAVRT